MGVFQPRDDSEIAEFLAASSNDKLQVSVRGGGSKIGLGRPVPDEAAILDTRALTGIVSYEPEELVLTAKAGTKLTEISTAIAERGQCMAFEPPDLGPLLGGGAEQTTLGGLVAAGYSGPRRIKAGAVRDHVLGATALGGDGQSFKSGGRVVKNVTGFDLPKLLTGSHGTLAVLTEISIKILPRPEAIKTLLIAGLQPAEAIRILCEALGGPFEVSGAAFLPDAAAKRSAVPAVAAAGMPMAVLRLEGFGPSIADRLAALQLQLRGRGEFLTLDADESLGLWSELRDVAPLLPPDCIVWRLSLPPTDAAATVAAIARTVPVDCFYDWGGGLVWLALPHADDGHAEPVRTVLPAGHATLVHAPDLVRATAPVFQPQPPGLSALSCRVKAAFDPAGILGVGRMYPDF